MRKVVSIILSAILMLSLLPFSRVYADDLKGIALEKEMRDMIAKGIMTSYGEGIYKPNEKINRGQFATYLSRALKLPEGEHRFQDVPRNSSVTAGINAAAAAGIIDGYTENTFQPNKQITREQMSIMINKALDYEKISKKKGSLAFTDEATITSSISRIAISYMVGLNIIQGYPNPNGKGLSFKPKNQVTRAETAAFLSRMLNCAEQETPQPPSNPNPPATGGAFRIGTIGANDVVTPSKESYKTYKEVEQIYKQNEDFVVLKNNEIIKMHHGITVSKPGKGNATTNVYEADMKTIYAPIAAGNELEYVTSDDSKVTVKVSGKIGYVKHSDLTLIPLQIMKGRSYYSINSTGDFVHNLFNHDTGKTISYIYGKAPATFKQDVKYYSWDGATFKDEHGKVLGTYHQYFNMLPIRTSTNYSGAELDQYLAKKLGELENLYKKNPSSYAKYKDATKKSKLVGLGTMAKEFEKYHTINALVIIGMAILESDYGMSKHAQESNNIFGIKVYDSNPQNGSKYASIRDCVTSLVTNYLNKNYIPVNGAYANGGVTGNKARGMNVRYASDPFWGQKIAGQMYQMDKAISGKDFLKNAKPYQIHETNSDSVNIRSTANVNTANKMYTYPRAGYPVAVIGTTTDRSWHKILSDSKEDLHGYVSSEYTSILPIAK